ncbi:hypothetical protein [Paraburkholderia tropica]|uniref:hypothetical protein n=3 Tax=Paraburkholderia tropica TaxID=92647 RepID=UPI001FC81634|nr:hypothetical protein [Paraburkholderia tropica]
MTCNWKEGGDSRAELHAAGGALIGGLGGGGAFSTIGGAAGAGLASKMAGTLNDISKGVASATGSELIGNLAANIAAGVGGAALGGTAGAAMASNVHLYNQTVDDERPLTGELGKKPLTLADYFMAGVKTALDLLPFGFGGGRPPAAGPGAVLVNGAGQALAAGISSSSTAAGYGPGNATLSSGNGGENGQQSASSEASNTATYPSLKGQLSDESLANIAGSDSRLAAAINGSGKSNPNVNIGSGTAAEADQLGKLWVGDGAKKTSDGSGWISADGTRVYRSPSQKDSPFATTGTQANFETYTINSITGQRVKIGNGHLNVTN